MDDDVQAKNKTFCPTGRSFVIKDFRVAAVRHIIYPQIPCDFSAGLGPVEGFRYANSVHEEQSSSNRCKQDGYICWLCTSQFQVVEGFPMHPISTNSITEEFVARVIGQR